MVKLSREEAGLGAQSRSGRSSQAGEQELGVRERGRTELAGGARGAAHWDWRTVGALPRCSSLSSLAVWSYLDLSQQRYDLRPLKNQGEWAMK